jgi:regulator of sirC expression with transglutaminase-like and TPR domain
VVITITGRDGARQGLGTGFVISSDGLIATNLHVIGEARPISVQTSEGKRLTVTGVHASDRVADLAIIRVDAKDLPPLEIANSDDLQDGQAVVALGNPHGLKHSVVSGVVSGRREIEGRSMIQLAIPIEPGNSGGPLLDMQGRVHGILTMKSLVTANLGFAVASNTLKPLIDKPNPIPMSRWLTIGTLDPKEWTVLFGGNWRQRAGRIYAAGAGSGFGGRSLCLAQADTPELPFEVAVTVRLDDESGAAGLVFHADGGDKHYGFYPSGGKLRLTRFDGPDVYSWTILHDEASRHYRPGEFNTLKVRVEKDRLLCYVNDELAVESKDSALTGGKVGLAKFRQTEAEFKDFEIGREITAAGVPAEAASQVKKLVETLPPRGAAPLELVEQLAKEHPAAIAALEQQARLLEQQAAQLQRLSKAVHQRRVEQELARELERKEDQIDLFRAGLLVARLDNPELEIEPYLKQLDRMAGEVHESLAADPDDSAKLAALNKYLFADNGFHGSRLDYYNRANSYLNEVLDDREGLPITLSVLYLELGRRLGLNLAGVGLPGHFVVKHIPKEGEPQLLDPFEGGKPLSRDDAGRLVEQNLGRPLVERDLQAVPKAAIVVRMLHNLRGVAIGQKDTPAVLRYLDAVLAVAPETVEDRSMRAVLRRDVGDRAGALADIDWLLQNQPEGVDLDRVREFRQLIERE